ncbi:MAG: 1-phosphofructokinase [Metamycoplasmataceae bacterium]
MIYTITFSPSIDYIVENNKADFNSNNLNRIEEYYFTPGGKGINASIILNDLKIDNKAIIFTGGKTEKLFFDLLNDYKINFSSIPLNEGQDTRINFKYFSNKNKFEVNGPSFSINNNQYENMINILKDISENDYVFIMGKCDEENLKKLVEFISLKKAKIILDIDSNIILDLLKFNPLIIKPNIDEAQSILNKKISTDLEIYSAAVSLKKLGSENVIISNGAKGNYLLDKDNNFIKTDFPKIENIKSTVGAGDTLISSFFAYKYLKNLSSLEAIKKATAMSISTSKNWHLGNENEANNYLKVIQTKNIN